MRVSSDSSERTRKIGRLLGRVLGRGDVVALSGELGSGKTTLVKGIAEGFGVRTRSGVTSPTFVIIHEYKGRARLFHLDWYRLKEVEGADAELSTECFRKDAAALVEWADRAPELIPADCLRIDMRHEGPSKRRMRICARGIRSQKTLRRFEQLLKPMRKE